MRLLTVYALLLPGFALGQSADPPPAAVHQLAASLAALRDTGSTRASHQERIANDLMALAEAVHPPSLATVARFAGGLVSTLSDKRLTEPQLSNLARGIVSVLRSAGVANSEFRQAVARTHNALGSLGVSATAAKRLSADLEAIGKDVRGPEDLPANVLR